MTLNQAGSIQAEALSYQTLNIPSNNTPGQEFQSSPTIFRFCCRTRAISPETLFLWPRPLTSPALLHIAYPAPFWSLYHCWKYTGPRYRFLPALAWTLPGRRTRCSCRRNICVPQFSPRSVFPATHRTGHNTHCHSAPYYDMYYHIWNSSSYPNQYKYTH